MRDLATRLFHPPFPSPSRNPSRVYRAILLCYCSRARRDIPVSGSRLDIHVTLRCQHGLGLVGFFVEMQLDSSLSLSLWRMLRGCLMVLRERRSGLVRFWGEATRRVWWMRAFESRLLVPEKANRPTRFGEGIKFWEGSIPCSGNFSDQDWIFGNFCRSKMRIIRVGRVVEEFWILRWTWEELWGGLLRINEDRSKMDKAYVSRILYTG